MTRKKLWFKAKEVVYLKATTVGDDWARVIHEFVKTASRFDYIFSRMYEQVKRIAEY